MPGSEQAELDKLDAGEIGALAEQADAAAAEAEAKAFAARARALELSQRAARESDESGPVPDADRADDAPRSPDAADPTPVPARRLRRPRWTTMAATVALLLTAGLVAASGFMAWQHRDVSATENDRAEFTAAARQVVVTLMSIDFNDPQASVQRIIDNSTGTFRDDFETAAEDFVGVAKDAKVTTNATVNAAAVESMTADSAVVLVAASSTVTNAAGADDAPRSWRLAVDLQRDGDQIKMSNVEFVP